MIRLAARAPLTCIPRASMLGVLVLVPDDLQRPRRVHEAPSGGATWPSSRDPSACCTSAQAPLTCILPASTLGILVLASDDLQRPRPMQQLDRRRGAEAAGRGDAVIRKRHLQRRQRATRPSAGTAPCIRVSRIGGRCVRRTYLGRWSAHRHRRRKAQQIDRQGACSRSGAVHRTVSALPGVMTAHLRVSPAVDDDDEPTRTLHMERRGECAAHRRAGLAYRGRRHQRRKQTMGGAAGSGGGEGRRAEGGREWGVVAGFWPFIYVASRTLYVGSRFECNSPRRDMSSANSGR